MDTKLDIQQLYFDLNKKKVKKTKSFDSGLCSLGIQNDIKREEDEEITEETKAKEEKLVK